MATTFCVNASTSSTPACAAALKGSDPRLQSGLISAILYASFASASRPTCPRAIVIAPACQAAGRSSALQQTPAVVCCIRGSALH
eukprot:1827975-Rhodomonas_salina.3